jgi:hypothetical protein
LNATLTQSNLDLPASQSRLEGLIQMQRRIAELPSLSDAMESLDLLIAFQEEFIDQIQILGDMRTNLVEFAILESTIAKALRSLQPLLELGNLKRMSNAELRSAARSVLEERTTRLINRPHDERLSHESKPEKEASVPKPSEAE